MWNFYNEEKNSPFVFPILHYTKTVREVWNMLKVDGIEIRTLMGGATSTQKAFVNRLPSDTYCPNAEYMSQHAFFVGCHNTLTDQDVEHVASALLHL